MTMSDKCRPTIECELRNGEVLHLQISHYKSKDTIKINKANNHVPSGILSTSHMLTHLILKITP